MGTFATESYDAPCSAPDSGVKHGLILGTGVYLGIQAPPRDTSMSCGSHRNHLSRVTSGSCVLRCITAASRASWSKGSATADSIHKHTACQYPKHSVGGAQQGKADHVEAGVEKTYRAQSRRNVGPSPLGGNTCSPSDPSLRKVPHPGASSATQIRLGG
jgi:hypothetical protein